MPVRRAPLACVWLTLALLVTAVVGCDEGGPTTEQQMRELGLPMDSLHAVDDEHDVTVRVSDGVPELVSFEDYRFGGSIMSIFPARIPTINGGMMGLGPHLMFGAGQGPVVGLEADVGGARAAIVNPDVHGWMIALPSDVAAEVTPWRLLDAAGATVYESVGSGLPIGFAVDDATGAVVGLRDGEPELRLYASNRFGGISLSTYPAEVRTIGDGTVGTVTAGGYRYVFGGGQGPIGPVILTRPADARSTGRAGDDGTWLVVAPEIVALDRIEWWLDDPEGDVALTGVGTHPLGIFVTNETDAPIAIAYDVAGDEPMPLRTVEAGGTRMVASRELTPDGGCTTGELLALDASGAVTDRHGPGLCPADMAIWTVGP
jgi:hypothetical protein